MSQDIGKLIEVPSLPLAKERSFSALFRWSEDLVFELKRIFSTTHNKINNHILQLFHVETLTSNVQTYTIGKLNGDFDEEYEVFGRIINQSGGAVVYYLRPNGDSGTNYGCQSIYGTGASAGANQNTADIGLRVGGNTNNGEICMFKAKIWAKSGYVRTCITTTMESVSGKTISASRVINSAWDNTTSNITSIDVYASASNGIGAGSVIKLWSK